MLFVAPELLDAERRVLADIADLQQRLGQRLRSPARWSGSLRRVEFARAVQGSNSIEGINASLDDAAAIDLGQPPLDADEDTRLAIKGYADAMTYVLQLHKDANFQLGEQLLRSLHFMMLSYDLRKRPGLWRPGAIWIEHEPTGETVYEAPDVDRVPALMRALVDQLEQSNHAEPIVDAAMAHLNLVMIHPFSDGNGRMGRCIQSLVLARNGLLSPVFCSIEEYLGANTRAYYDVLAKVGRGAWNPQNDTRPWARFVLTAHLHQARTTLRRANEVERLWIELDRLVEARGINPRATVALYDATIGFRVRNGTYRATVVSESGDEINEATATRDLKQLQDGGLLVPHGEKRGRYYTRGEALVAILRKVTSTRTPRDNSDPFASAE